LELEGFGKDFQYGAIQMILLEIAGYKKFFLLFLIFLASLLMLNFIIWESCTENLLSGSSEGGDLARLGYVTGSKSYRKNSCDLPKRHIDQDLYAGQRIDLVTIGDSFSNGVAGGKNRFYQDYIASLNGINVLNISPYEYLGPVQSLVVLINNGYLDKVKPRFVLLQLAEKHCIEKLSGPVDFKMNIDKERLKKLKIVRYKKPSFNVSFINQGNLNYLVYNFLRIFSPNGHFLKTYVVDLSESFFSVRNDRKLLFYHHDIAKIANSNDMTISALNANLNNMAQILKKKNIRLYFMPAVDKYDLYSDYIVNNEYPKSIFFEKLRLLPKMYTLIDTKKILAQEVNKGEKDIFYADDTHWSWKASEKIFSTIRFK
jgi:hypothetical protein